MTTISTKYSASTFSVHLECFGNFIQLGRELEDLASGQSLQHLALCDHPLTCLAFGNLTTWRLKAQLILVTLGWDFIKLSAWRLIFELNAHCSPYVHIALDAFEKP